MDQLQAEPINNFSHSSHCGKHGYAGACYDSLTTTLIHGYTVHCIYMNFMYLLVAIINSLFSFISLIWWGSTVHLQSVKQRRYMCNVEILKKITLDFIKYFTSTGFTYVFQKDIF